MQKSFRLSKNHMKTKIFLMSLLIILFITGCNDENSTILSTAISQIDMKTNGHIEQLEEYNSPYTICYKNKDDTYSMYIFASPIQYKDNSGKYAIIDNTVIESEKDEFKFENKANNIKTYFPATLSDSFRIEKDNDFLEFNLDWNIEGFLKVNQTIFTNMYGDKVSAIIYERKDMD